MRNPLKKHDLIERYAKPFILNLSDSHIFSEIAKKIFAF